MLATIQRVPTWLRLAVAVVLVALFGGAIAQEVVIPEPGMDPRAWFGSPLAMAGAVAAVVGFIKARFNLHGTLTLAVSFGTGILLAVMGSLNLPVLGKLYDGSIVEALVFGASAAVIASGGWDVVKGLLMAAVANLGKR